jgi:ABC-type antimicrobial peptide transport system permease subunit
MSHTTAIVIAGLAIGAPLAAIASSLVANRLFGVGPADPATIVIAVLTLAGVTAIAGFLPARRATRIDPNTALRYD